jgi:hypothetical protein
MTDEFLFYPTLEKQHRQEVKEAKVTKETEFF